MAMRFFLVVLCSCISAFAGTSVPETPAGKALGSYLDAFNSADLKKLTAFKDAYDAQWFPDYVLKRREAIGTVTLVDIEKSEPRQLVVLLQVDKSKAVARWEFALDDKDPPHLTRMGAALIKTPPELLPSDAREISAAALPAAPADSRIANTLAGRAFSQWLAAANTRNEGQMQQFRDAWYSSMNVAEAMREIGVDGGYSLVKVVRNEPLELSAVLRGKDIDRVVLVEMALTTHASPRMYAFATRLPTPAEYSAPRTSDAVAIAAFDKFVSAEAAADRFSGAILVAHDGKILLQKAWGLADREAKLANNVDTQFNTASVGKMFTTVAILQLVAAGKMSLDDTVGRFIPDYPDKETAAKVTVRHLLANTGGTGDILDENWPANRLKLKTHSDYVAMFGARALLFPPGSRFDYSNYGFALMGALIEKASGLSFHDYVEKNVFQAAGMADTGYPLEAIPVARHAKGYINGNGTFTSNFDLLPYRGMAYGVGYTTVADMLKFAQALQDGKLVPTALLDQATTKLNSYYGLGFYVEGEGKSRYFGHEGATYGMSTELRIYPLLGYVMVALSNQDQLVAERMVEYFARGLSSEAVAGK